jgi:hypothetical protein
MIYEPYENTRVPSGGGGGATFFEDNRGLTGGAANSFQNTFYL